jgi:microcompartment protein CcmL/EutN
MNSTAIGLIETLGLVGAIEALDACLKAANVELIKKENTTGGLVTIMIRGDVAAVQAAIDAGSAAASRVGTVISAHVIPRLSEEVFRILDEVAIIEAPLKVQKEMIKQMIQEQVVNEVSPKEVIETESYVGYKGDDLNQHKVTELRHIARELNITTIDRQKIKYANKTELIEGILNHLKGGE